MRYAFFPYLHTTERLFLHGVEFRTTQDLAGLTATDKEAVEQLAGMFCLHDGTAPGPMTFALLDEPGDDPAREAALYRSLDRSQAALAYLYTAPHPAGGTSLTAEHASLFVFREWRDMPISLATPGRARDPEGNLNPGEFGDGTQAGFHGVRDLACSFFVAPGSRIHPQFPFFWVPASREDVAHDADEFLRRPENWPLSALFRQAGPRVNEESLDRAFTSLRWYLAGCRYCVDEAEAILFTAIALESLLRVSEGDRLTERFKEAVLTLLGPIPRLDEWLEQFYSARSKTVHEGRPHSVNFIPNNRKGRGTSGAGGTPYRPLLDYGRGVYRLCLTTVLTGATVAAHGRLEASFVPNAERLTRICAVLSKDDQSARDGVLAVTADCEDLTRFGDSMLSQRPGALDLDAVWGAARLLFRKTLAAVPNLRDEIAAILREASNSAAQLDTEQLKKIGGLRRLLEEARQGGTADSHEAALDALRHFTTFLASADVSFRVAVC